MAPKLYRVILPVSDIARATEFYETVLGNKGQRVTPGRHYFDCGGTILACFDSQLEDDVAPKPLPEWLYFAVEDIESTFRACEQAGAIMSSGEVHGTPAGEIHTRPWGERSFYAQDPFDNKICFVDRSTVFAGQ